MGRVDDKLRALGLVLPEPAAPAATYVPFVQSGSLVFVSGQIPTWNGERRFVGKVGQEYGIEEAKQAAHLVALNLLAQVRAACDGDLDRVRRCVRLGGFVNCTTDFNDHPLVVNAASELLLAVFGEAGRHARAAVGAPSLPFGVAVEIDAIFEIEG